MISSTFQMLSFSKRPYYSFLHRLAASSIGLFIAACSGSVDTAPKSLEMWAVKTANHGLGSLQDQNIVTMTNGDLYLIGSRLVGNNYSPLLAKSTDGGVTWVQKTALPFPSLRRFAAVSNGIQIIVTGGRTSDATVAAQSYAYNSDVYRYETSNDTWSVVSVSPFAAFSPFSAKERHAMAFNGVSSIFLTGGGSNVGGLTYRVYESQDAGVTWTQKGVDPFASHYNLENHCLLASGTTLYSLGGGGNPTTNNSYISNLTYTLRSLDSGATWSVMSTTMPDTANFSGCALVAGTIYSTGGLNDKNQTSNITRKSSNGGSSWTIDLNSTVLGSRYNHGMTTRNNKLIVFGGLTADKPSEKLDVIEGVAF